jgi:hypothetical protein
MYSNLIYTHTYIYTYLYRRRDIIVRIFNINLFNCGCNCFCCSKNHICIVFILCSVSFIACVVLCAVFCLSVVCYFV